MTDNETRSTKDAIDLAIGEVLFNARNFPERAQSHILGENLAPLRKKLVAAVINAIPVPSETAELIAEAITSSDGMATQSKLLLRRLAVALDSESREVERLRMALREKEQA